MLSKKKMEQMIVEYDELKMQLEAIKAQMEERENGFKAEMERRGVSELEVGNRTVRWTSFTSQRFDSTAFRKAEPELYKQWTKEVNGHRFTVS